MSEVIFSPRSMISFKYVGNKEVICRDHKIDNTSKNKGGIRGYWIWGVGIILRF